MIKKRLPLRSISFTSFEKLPLLIQNPTSVVVKKTFDFCCNTKRFEWWRQYSWFKSHWTWVCCRRPKKAGRPTAGRLDSTSLSDRLLHLKRFSQISLVQCFINSEDCKVRITWGNKNGRSNLRSFVRSLETHNATKTILFLMSVQCVMMFQLKEKKTLQRRIPQIINPCKSWQPPHVDRALFTASPPLMSVGRFFFYRFAERYMLWRFHYFPFMCFLVPGTNEPFIIHPCAWRRSHWRDFASHSFFDESWRFEASWSDCGWCDKVELFNFMQMRSDEVTTNGSLDCDLSPDSVGYCGWVETSSSSNQTVQQPRDLQRFHPLQCECHFRKGRHWLSSRHLFLRSISE